MGSGRRALVLGTVALAMLAVLGGLGESAAVPGLGPRTAHPPWDLAVGAPSAVVTGIGVVAYLLGAVAVWSGLRAVRAGAGVPARGLLAAGIAAACVLTLVPPAGSADHLSYLAYGRIAAAGDDAYAVPPATWHGGTDPVAGAVQPPWQDTPSVYGPVATGLFALVARLGDGSLRLTVWWWSLVCAAAFAAVGLMLHAAHRGDAAAQTRAAVLWTANPLLLGQLVLGAHLDVVAAALSLAALLLVVRSPVPAGALIGAAAAVKAPYALFGVAALWGLRTMAVDQRWRSAASGLFGAALVLGPAYALAGPHVLDQVRTAGGFTSIASPWRGLVNLIELGAGRGAMRPVVVPLALLVAAGLAWALHRAVRVAADGPPAQPAVATGQAAGAALALTAAWVMAAPYALPWYDAMVWAPLALFAAGGALTGLETILLVRLAVLALAYLPGRVVGLSADVETVTLGFRRYVAPAVMLAVVPAALRWARGRGRVAVPASPEPGR